MAEVSTTPTVNSQGPIMPPLASESTTNPETTRVPDRMAPVSLASLLEELQKLETLKGAYASIMARAAAAQGPEPHMLYAAADVPVFVENLTSSEDNVFNKGSLGLASIIRHQPDLAKSEIVPHIPFLLAFMITGTDEPRKVALINLLSTIQPSSREASDAFEAHLNAGEVMLMFKKEARQETAASKSALLKLLESMLRGSHTPGDKKGGSGLERRIVEVLGAQLNTFGRKTETVDAKGKGKAGTSSDGWTIGEALGFIQTFEKILGDKHGVIVCFAFLRAGVLEFLVRVASTQTPYAYVASPESSAGLSQPSPTLTEVRVAAITCLAQLYGHIVKETVVPSNFFRLSFAPDAKFDLQGRVLMPLLDIIDDEDAVVSDHVVNFMFSHFKDPDQAVEVYLWTHGGSMERIQNIGAIQSMGMDPFAMMELPGEVGQGAGLETLAGQGEQASEKPVPTDDAMDNKPVESEGERQSENQDSPKDGEGGDGSLVQGEAAQVKQDEVQMKQESRSGTDEADKQPLSRNDEGVQQPCEHLEGAEEGEHQGITDALLAEAQGSGMSAAQLKFLMVMSWADSHSQAEWLLQYALRRNPDGGVDAFGTFWARRDVEEKTKQALLRVLSRAIGEVQKAARRAGLPMLAPESSNEAQVRFQKAEENEEPHQSDQAPEADRPGMAQES